LEGKKERDVRGDQSLGAQKKGHGAITKNRFNPNTSSVLKEDGANAKLIRERRQRFMIRRRYFSPSFFPA
jgi:hypothetical protein